MRRGIKPSKRFGSGLEKGRKPKIKQVLVSSRYLRVRSSKSNKIIKFTIGIRQAFLGNLLPNFQRLLNLKKT